MVQENWVEVDGISGNTLPSLLVTSVVLADLEGGGRH